MAYRLSVNDETFDEKDGSVTLIYRHSGKGWHPCEYACNSQHPLNKAVKMQTFVLDRKTWSPA